MANEKLRVLLKDGPYQLHSVYVSEEKRTKYWLIEMNPNVKVGVGKQTNIDAKTHDEAIEIAKVMIEELSRK